jgi:acetyltransferase-like isoleucine patch superfamily enzyme
MKPGFKERLVFFLRHRVVGLSRLRVFYWRLVGMKIGAGTTMARVHATWPHQVRIGAKCRIEHEVYFHFDGIYGPGPSIVLGDRCFVGAGCEFNIRDRVELGDGCLVGAGTRFVDHDHNIEGTGPLPPRDGPQAPIQCGNHVWIGANVVVLKGVNIGEGAVVAAGAVVTKNIPSNEIWGGVPARKIGERKDG